MKKTTILSMILLLALSAVAEKRTYALRQGDKAFSVFNYTRAIDFYSVGLRKHKGDTLYMQQQIAESYRLLNQPVNAELWYRKVVNRPDKPLNKLYLAEALKENQRYEEAKVYYQKYKAAVPADKSVDELISGLDSVASLSQDKGIYKAEILNINSPASDFGPAFYTDGRLFFTSNRNGKRDNNLIDNWSTRNYYQIFIAKPQSQGSATYDVKKVLKCKPNGKFHDGPVTFYAANNELIFTRSNYKHSTSKAAADKKTVNLQLYTMTFTDKKRSRIKQLSMDSKDYSTAHPSLSADGKTLYFSSDRAGGQGGTDIYVSTRSSISSPWEAPVNLGVAINTKSDEKFPFIANDGTLYFASNKSGGLGGLDIYMTRKEDGKWSTPENLGYPVNSSMDDFSFIVDSAGTRGYFASNRSGGVGDDDIYGFTAKPNPVYNVSVQVVDATTQQPISDASVTVECPKTKTDGSSTNADGKKDFAVKNGLKCTVNVTKDNYIAGTAQVSATGKNQVITISLARKELKLIVHVKDKDTQAPVSNVGVDLTAAGKPSYTFSTDSNGEFQTGLAVDQYTISSPEYTAISGQISTADADPATWTVTKEYLIDSKELIVNVPLTANCFISTVAYTDLTTQERKEVQPNKEMYVRLDLKLNRKYTIEHNGTTDTINTRGLRPGQVIEGPCKFYVGQTWVIHNIYYDLNKSIIRPDAAKELDKVVRVMKDNPTLEVELGSHTDCRQTFAYNNQLSVRRAKAAVSYIASKKIRMSRILAAGYGESKLVNNCACEPTNVSDCTDQQHSQNRRTEVKVLKY